MAVRCTWPDKVMKSKWRVSKLLSNPAAIVSEATGHNFIDIGCDVTCEKNLATEQEIAQHVVDLHNAQLGK